jgi:hypothetical protein
MGSNVGGSSDKLLHRFIISVDDSRSIQYAYVLPIFFIVLYKKKKKESERDLYIRGEMAVVVRMNHSFGFVGAS